MDASQVLGISGTVGTCISVLGIIFWWMRRTVLRSRCIVGGVTIDVHTATREEQADAVAPVNTANQPA